MPPHRFFWGSAFPESKELQNVLETLSIQPPLLTDLGKDRESEYSTCLKDQAGLKKPARIWRNSEQRREEEPRSGPVICLIQGHWVISEGSLWPV